MTIIKLERAVIQNWRGIKKFDHVFDEMTNIHGKNGSGKSTAIDAIMWTWTGKDAFDRKNFEIKPRDLEGDHTADSESSTELFYTVNKTRKLVMKRAWVSRFDKAGKLTGHDTKLWIDGEKFDTEAAFKAELDKLIHPELFSILTNPAFFFNMDEPRQRKYLVKIAGEVTDEEVIVDDKFDSIRDEANRRGIDGYKKMLTSQINELKGEKKEKPGLITEAGRPLLDAPDFKGLDEKIKKAKKDLDVLAAELEEASNGENFTTHNKKVKELSDTRIEMANARAEFLENQSKEKTKIANRKAPLEDDQRLINRNLRTMDLDLATTEKNIEKAGKTLAALGEAYDAMDESVFEPGVSDVKCDECGHVFTEEEIEAGKSTAEAEFNVRKDKILDDYDEKGKTCKEEIEAYEKAKALLLKQKEAECAKLVEVEKTLAKIKPDERKWEETEEYSELNSKIKELEEIVAEPPTIDDKELIARKETAAEVVEDLTKLAGEKVAVDKAKKRVKELEDELIQVNLKITEREAELDLVSELSRLKSQILQDRVNEKFKIIKFKLFKNLVKGGEPEEVCEATRDGVLYKTVNTAGKIEMFIDLINTLSAESGMYIPVFLDSRESVTKIPSTKSQVVNFFVFGTIKSQPSDIIL